MWPTCNFHDANQHQNSLYAKSHALVNLHMHGHNLCTQSVLRSPMWTLSCPIKHGYDDAHIPGMASCERSPRWYDHDCFDSGCMAEYQSQLTSKELPLYYGQVPRAQGLLTIGKSVSVLCSWALSGETILCLTSTGAY